MKRELDLTVDGAWSIRSFSIKATARCYGEKIVAAASAPTMQTVSTIATLGQFPLPVEVMPFGLAANAPLKNYWRASPRVKRCDAAGTCFVTDGGHWVLDAALGRIDGTLL